MKVLFAVSNENTSQNIIKKYQAEYKQIISYKNVYYFNAILKELQRDKTYDRVVISEDLEQYVNNDYEQMDKFLFDKLDSISDEASNINGEDIPIILICSERRNKSEQILVKLFGIGVYDALIGNDRSAVEVCRLINRPRSKKDAKLYYKIDAEDVSYGKESENDVSELEIQNILAHYKKIGNNEGKYVESFDSIAEQYNDEQLKVISKCLPLNVRAVLEEKSTKYQEINSYNNKISDKIRIDKKDDKKGTSEILLKNENAKRLNKPVVIPSEIDASKKKKILTKSTQPIEKSIPKVKEPEPHKNEYADNIDVLEDIELEEVLDNNDILQDELPIVPLEQLIEEVEEKEDVVQTVKRGRGRPKKNATEPVVEQPKRKRGRPKKIVDNQEEIENDNRETGFLETEENNEMLLPGFEEEDNETLLPGFEEDDDEILVSGFEEDDDETLLPGFEEDDNETLLPGFEEDDDEALLPGFEEDDDIEANLEENEQNEIELPGINNEYEDEMPNPTITPVFEQKMHEPEHIELNMENVLNSNQKIVAFLGTSKNGTSFLVNNIAEILSINGIDTAIVDLTKNRNSYYIYTKNDEQLRNKSNYIFENLKGGKANGIVAHKNLTIYTSPIEGDEKIEAVEPIIETLAQNHTLILMDCDFDTPMRYFKYATEIYLVQSMDILTIQPLTAFVRQLLDKGMFKPEKARVVLNKFIRTRELNENILIGGMSIYNDPAMTVRKELFDRKMIPKVVIPLSLKSYLRYLDGLATCDISLKGYEKEFVASLKELANMVYQQQTKKKNGKYMPPSVKNNNGFSPRVNNTLNQMKQNY